MIDLHIDASQLATTKANPMYRFYLEYTGRLMPTIDSYNRNLSARLTRRAREKLESGALRPQERGSRPGSRLTGRLGPAIQGSALGKGLGTGSSGTRVGRGVGWPNVNTLNRRARHWRRIEFGATFTLPRGLFVPGAGGDVFFTYRDFLKSRGLSTSLLVSSRSRRARARAVSRARDKPVFLREVPATIEGRFFLTQTWDEIVGPNGEHVGTDYARIIRDSFTTG